MHGVDAKDGADRAAHIFERRAEEMRLARLWIRRDRDVRDGEVTLSCLNQRLERVTETGDHVEPKGGLAAVRAEAGGHVGYVGPRGLPDDPRAPKLEKLLDE